MGRKIPSKKHNKLKSVDPFNRKPNSNIFKKKDELHNLAPKKLSQEAPGALKKLFGDPDSMEEPTKKRRKKTDRITVQTLDHRHDTASLLTQNTYETDEQFLKRVSQMANRARERADISIKHDVLFNEDGTVEADLPEGSSLPTRKKRRLLAFKERQKSKLQKLKERSLPAGKKTADDDEPIKEFPGRESFQFGEVVHAPPEITAKLRGAPEKDSKKIARNLLCNPDNLKKANNEAKVEAGDGPQPAKTTKTPKKAANSKASGAKTEVGESQLEKIRWKKLEASKRAELEKERLRAIEAYRRLKNKV